LYALDTSDSMNIEEKLQQETEKWLNKIIVERKKLVACSKKDFLKNIDAYISDSEHFLAKNDLIRAFEAVIWAWAYMEIGKDLKIIKDQL